MANDKTKMRTSQSSTAWKAKHVLAVFGLFGVGFIEMGVMKSFGVLVDDLVINFHSDSGTIGLVIGAFHGITFFISPFVTPLLKYLGTWNLAAIAMASAGCLCASSYSSSLASFSVALLFSGVCYSFVILAAINKFYELVPSEGSDIAYGFADSGNAIGMICLPILTEYFKGIYGWRGTILLLAGIGFHVTICILLIRGPSSDVGVVEKKPKSNDEEEQTNNDLEPLLPHSLDIICKIVSDEERNVSDSIVTDSQNPQGLRRELDGQAASRYAEIVGQATANKGIKTSNGPFLGKSQKGDLSETCLYRSIGEDSNSMMDHSDVPGNTICSSDSESNLNTNRYNHMCNVPDLHDKEAKREPCDQVDQLNNDQSHFCSKFLCFMSDALGLRLLITKPALITIYLYFLVSGSIMTSWVVFLIPHGVSKGYPLSKAVYLASFGGIGNMIGRIAQGPIIHKRWLNSIDLTIILCIFNASIFLVDPLVSSFAVLGVNAFIGGLTLGARITLCVVLIKQFMPNDQFSTAIGFSCFFKSIGEPLGGLMAGWLADVLDFGMAFMVLGAIELGVCLLLILSRYFLTREDEHDE